MAATALTANPIREEINWANFVGNVASCSNTANSSNTFSCLRNSSSSDIGTGVLAAINEASEIFPFRPKIDGEGNLYPDLASKLLSKGLFSRLPFIAGTNLDEGKYPSSPCLFWDADSNSGTSFMSPGINSEQVVRDNIISNYTPSAGPFWELVGAADKLMQLYPDVPALGSPFNTGNQTFGLSSKFKQASAIS
jgi:acetylcholinesterase